MINEVNANISGSSRTCSIIDIAGGSASGKSTFAARVATVLRGGLSALTVETIASDRYYTRDIKNGPTIALTTGSVMFDYNHPDATDNEKLVCDIIALRDKSDGPDVIIVEGLMVLYVPSIRELLDIRLFIELDADQRALRRILRDMSGGRANKDPQFIADYYLESARVGHQNYVEPSRQHADFILRGDGDFARTANMISPIIQTWKVASA